MVFLAVLDLVRVDVMRRMRKPAIFALVVLSAIITPPDPITLLLMAGPLVLLYELGIVVSWIITVRRERLEAAKTRREPPPPPGVIIAKPEQREQGTRDLIAKILANFPPNTGTQ